MGIAHTKRRGTLVLQHSFQTQCTCRLVCVPLCPCLDLVSSRVISCCRIFCAATLFISWQGAWGGGVNLQTGTNTATIREFNGTLGTRYVTSKDFPGNFCPTFLWNALSGSCWSWLEVGAKVALGVTTWTYFIRTNRWVC